MDHHHTCSAVHVWRITHNCQVSSISHPHIAEIIISPGQASQLQTELSFTASWRDIQSQNPPVCGSAREARAIRVVDVLEGTEESSIKFVWKFKQHMAHYCATGGECHLYLVTWSCLSLMHRGKI